MSRWFSLRRHQKSKKKCWRLFATVWFPELIKLGALSCRYISIDDTKPMIINMFPDQTIVESVQVGREEQRKELREQHKYTVFKGYSEFYLEK